MITTAIQFFYWLGSDQAIRLWHMSPVANYILWVAMALEWFAEVIIMETI